MYFSSLQGHGTSLTPSASGMPTECRAGTKNAFFSSIALSGASPMRVMIRIERTT